jgi:hypothetical protein
MSNQICGVISKKQEIFFQTKLHLIGYQSASSGDAQLVFPGKTTLEIMLLNKK